MNLRTAGAFAALLVGTIGPGGLALAQYYPAPPPGSPAYPAQPLPSQPAPGVEDDDGPFYDPSMVQSRPLPPPPGAGGAQAADPVAPANARYGHAGPADPDNQIESLPPPPDYFYRDRPQDGPQDRPQDYELSSQPGTTRIVRPNPPVPNAAPSEEDGLRPPMVIGPAQAGAPPAGATGMKPDARFAALPPDEQPEAGPVKELPPQFRRTLVDYKTKEPPGTLIIDTPNTYLYLVLDKGKALRYGIGVGREGFTWAGREKVSRMAEWPDWHPPEEMIERQPYLPRFMAGGPGNPLGARALYLGSTVYRIHGTNQPSTIGTFVSSGCIRLTNEDVSDLYTRVKVGTRVVVLPGKAPPTPTAMQLGPSAPPAAAAAANAAVPPATVRPGAAIAGAPLPPPPGR
jgi:lipoprotein-anchoring transpeptidase ErfK/SrfK